MHQPMHNQPTELRRGTAPAEIVPHTQCEAAAIARLRTAALLGKATGPAREQLAASLGMNSGEVIREVRHYEDVASGRAVPTEIDPRQVRSIIGPIMGGAK